MNDQVMGLIRMGLVFLGAFVVQAGWLDQGGLDALIGSLISLIGVVWSIYNKWGTARVPVDTLTTKQTAITGVQPKV
jgi:hypothetical protein